MPFEHPLAADGTPDSLKNVESFHAPPDRLAPDVHSQLTNPQDISSANQFFKPAGGQQYFPQTDIGAHHIDIAPAAPHGQFAVPHITSLETQGLQVAVPGDASGLAAAQGLPGAMPGAEQISPLINMIMKMPGHIGLVGSFFEALGAFFAPAAEAMGHLAGGLDIGGMFEHAGAAAEAVSHGLEHGLESASHAVEGSMHVDLRLLPSEAPIFDQIGHTAGGAHGLDFNSNPLNFNPEHSLRDSFAQSNKLEVGGGPNGPIFEMGPNAHDLNFAQSENLNNYVAMEPNHGFSGTVGNFSPAHATVTPQPAINQNQVTPNGIQNAMGNQPAETGDFGRDVAQPTHEQTADTTSGGKSGGLLDKVNASAEKASDNTGEIADKAPLEQQTYTVHNGDNLWDIARDHLGDGTRWEEIYNLNQDVLGANPRLIMPGTELHLPGAEQIANSTDYTVQSGDNLWDISKDHLGGGQNWHELFQNNQTTIGADPGVIHPGQHLSLDGAGHHNEAIAQHDVAGAQHNLASHHSAPAAHHTQTAPHHAAPAAHKVAQTPAQASHSDSGELKAHAQSLSSLPANPNQSLN